MATRKRDIVPCREKPTSASQTGTTKLRGTLNNPSKTITKHTLNSTTPKKQVPTSLRSTTARATTATNVSKQPLPGKKPVSVDAARKPTQLRRTSSEKPLTPTQKPRLLNNSSLRSSSFNGKTAVSQKPVPGRNVKPVAKDAGRRLSNTRRSSTGSKKQETGNSTLAIKEEITYSPEKVETLSISSSISNEELETWLQDQECPVAEFEEKTVQIVGNNEKGTDDIVPEDQEQVVVAKTEEESDHNEDTTKNVIAVEFPTVFEHQESPVDVKPQESEDEYHIEENSTNETNTCDKGEILAHDGVGEEEVKEVEVVEEEQETALSKKDEVASGDEAQEFKEGQEVVVEKKQEPENVPPKQQERVHGKKDSAVSNDVIEETASKLREQRKNKVKALAGAFETVISLQGDSY